MPDQGDDGRRRMACVECRQQKVKCIGREGSSDCKRCKNRGLECIVDADYKRTAKRKRLTMLEEEMKKLRSNLALTSGTNGQPVANGEGSSNICRGNCVVTAAESRKYDATTSLPSAVFVGKKFKVLHAQLDANMHVDWNCGPKTADGLDLDPGIINRLYNEFVGYYHPILPIVDVSKGPEKIYELSSPLFWTIMAVASRRYDAYSPSSSADLCLKLSAIQKACLADIAVSPVTRYAGNQSSASLNLPSVYAVQALLLSTLWPLPTSSLNADSSWNTCGIAYFTGMRAGLHCPGHERDFGRVIRNGSSLFSARICEQVVTWLTINAVMQAVSCVFGYPSVSSFSRQSVLEDLNVPLHLAQLYTITRAINDIETTLGLSFTETCSNVRISDRLSLISMFSERLDEIERQFVRGVTPYSGFMMLAARVQLYSYYFFDSDKLPSMQIQGGYVAVYNSCLALLEYVKSMASKDERFVLYMPLVNLELLWQASSIVAKLHFSKWSTHLDCEQGSELYKSAISIISKASIFKHDVPFRAAEVLAQMWDVFEVMAQTRNPKIRDAVVCLRTRKAASVFFDCLWIMREECEIMSQAPAVLKERTLNRVQSHATQSRILSTCVNRQTALEHDGDVDTAHDKLSRRSSSFDQPLGEKNPQISDRALEFGQQYSDSRTDLPQQSSHSEQSDIVETASAVVNATTDNGNNESLDLSWDANTVWRDVDFMMEDFGFQLSNFSMFDEEMGNAVTTI